MSRGFVLTLLAALCFTCAIGPPLPAVAGEGSGFVLSGQITDIDGKPVAGAEIFAYDSAVVRRPADFISARTAADGHYRLTLYGQKFWVVARVRSGEKFGPLLPGDRHSGEPVIVEPDGATEVQQDFTVVDIREAVRQKRKVRADFRQVTGRILDQKGTPVSAYYVFACSGQAVKNIPDYISAWTGAGGEYTLYLPPGRYFLGASADFPPQQGTPCPLELALDKETQLPVRDIVVTREQPDEPGQAADRDSEP